MLETMIRVASFCNKCSQVFQLWLYVFMKSNLCVMVGVNVVDMSRLNVTTKQDIRCSFDVQYDGTYCWYCVHYINNFEQLSTVQCTQSILILFILAGIFQLHMFIVLQQNCKQNYCFQGYGSNTRSHLWYQSVHILDDGTTYCYMQGKYFSVSFISFVN